MSRGGKSGTHNIGIVPPSLHNLLLCAGEHVWTASDVERSLWSCAVADKPRKPAARRKRKAE